MQHIRSILESSVFGRKNPVNKPYSGAMHGISPLIPAYQAQLACKVWPTSLQQRLLGDH